MLSPLSTLAATDPALPTVLASYRSTPPSRQLAWVNAYSKAVTVLLLVPYVPGLRDIPRLIPVHRLIWRGWEGPQRQGRSPGTARGG